jgi:DNA gyrase/topoisomerase IV subunit A
MATFGLGGEVGAVLDLTSPQLSSELAEIDERIQVLTGLIDAHGRLEEVNEVIRFCTDPRSALLALQQEPFGYSRCQAQAVLDMPMSWQAAEIGDALRQERAELASRRAGLREQVAEILALHWFG